MWPIYIYILSLCYIHNTYAYFQLNSVTQSYPTLWDPMDCSTSGFPVLHRLLELVQTHVPRVGDAIQPSHPLPFPSPPDFNLSQHQCFFQWVISLHHLVKVLELQAQQKSFQFIFKADFLYYWLVWSPCTPRDSQESPPTLQLTIPRCSVSLWSSSHIHTWLLEKP